jgi:hypothetical protein
MLLWAGTFKTFIRTPPPYTPFQECPSNQRAQGRQLSQKSVVFNHRRKPKPYISILNSISRLLVSKMLGWKTIDFFTSWNPPAPVEGKGTHGTQWCSSGALPPPCDAGNLWSGTQPAVAATSLYFQSWRVQFKNEYKVSFQPEEQVLKEKEFIEKV